MKIRYLLTTLGYILVLLILVTSCATPTSTTTSIEEPSYAAPGATSSTRATTTTAPATTTAALAKPTGELVVAVSEMGSEQFLPWVAAASDSNSLLLIYDAPIYYEENTGKQIPGLVESWELSSDFKTFTFHIRKGVKWQEGWGEVTAEDFKYNFEQWAGPVADGIKLNTAREIASMELPDQYTLVINLKNPNPTWWQEWSMGSTGNGQGIVCKKYVETEGEEKAAHNPIGSGPYKLIEQKFGIHYKFEAYDQHWRVVPEFKYVTIRIVPESSTQVAMLKTGEIDLASVSAEALPELNAAGLATESNAYGGSSTLLLFGGMIDKEDKRFVEGYHRQDPWVDIKVRKAMNIAIDREAINKALYKGTAEPMGVPIATVDHKKYQYPYDPTSARQLLVEAGYPDGFKFELYSWSRPGMTEIPRVIEAVASYWEQIGLKPKIVNQDQVTFMYNSLLTAKTAGKIAHQRHTCNADPFSKITGHYTPAGGFGIYEDDATYAMFKEAQMLSDAEARAAAFDKIQQYWHDNYAVIPLVRVGYHYAWDPDKISPFPHAGSLNPLYLDYVRHAQPLNTFRLFSPWAGR